jgi:hypothetical protein
VTALRLDLVEPAAGDAGRRLRDGWRAASLRAGWSFPQDWWSPAVEAVVDALVDGRDLTAPCAGLGRARAEAGVGLDEVLVDFAAVPGMRAAVDPLVRAVAGGWAEVACRPASLGLCEDPLTGLATPAYLRTRLGEAYREAARSGVPVAGSHALVVVAVEPADGSRLLTTSRLLLVGAALRDAFPGGETLAAAGPTRAVALVDREPPLGPRAAALHRLLAERLGQAGSPPARVWIERLPATLGAACQLLAGLAR